MYRRLIWNDFKKSKLSTLTIFIFTGLVALLISVAAILFVNLTGSIDTLMEKAKTAHFMQMHTGEINQERLKRFAMQNSTVEEYQVAEFLNIDGTDIVLKSKSLSDSVQDNGVSIQNKKFDLLLDLEGNEIKVQDGEIYVPIIYKKEYALTIHDKVYIKGMEFVIAGFLRDSQMNSSLSSSKRFLVSESEYEKLKEKGNIEYLIEFRLADLSKLGEFEAAYTNFGLEANGPAVTYPLFKFLSAISDGMLIVIILLISILVLITSFLCIRFILVARLEEDYREIGVMKAIGIRDFDIKKIYMAKYAVIFFSGCMLGYLLSLLIQDELLKNIRLTIGESKNANLSVSIGMVGILAVFILMMLYVNRVMRYFKKISGAEAIRFGRRLEKGSSMASLQLNKNRLYPVNFFLGMKYVLIRRKLYFVLLLVLIISTFIMVVPNNLYSTLSSESFITYMGVGKCDFRVDIAQSEDILSKTKEVVSKLEKDQNILKYTQLTTKAFIMTTEEGEKKSIKIELGDHTVFPIQYENGQAPTLEHEIAISAMNAEALQKTIGDTILVNIDGQERPLIVCGIYSDITNGGKTTKAAFTNRSGTIIWSVICAQANRGIDIDSIVSEYAKQFDFAKISDVDVYVRQTFGNTLQSVNMAARTAVLVAMLIPLFVTLLFIRMLVAKDKHARAILRVVGFRPSDITKQYMGAAIFILILALLLGTGLSNTLGEVIAGKMIKGLGVHSFRFHINPYVSYIRSPFLLAGITLIAVIIATHNAGKVKMAEQIKE
ncbi:ABC transporter permease [Anaerocolumna cellulosilytica]|uniref:ABC transporter permease n=1 Tax=Anaerocolumna cellulosilytica TaxID=433286 RepID=A0A6S6QXN1_9FIRM|nr:ABC transporter permease [Anaerocolumna cellulosilytica]MBB5195575.1 putative ABC transport system permease protein [Anaerocolumna cellulosilytica]BCJ93819.1 ABC transporter permease [Anaerocolumna cellulosilytica]